MKIEWRQIPIDSCRYEASNTGLIRHKDRKIPLKPSTCNKGMYCTVSISRKTIRVHKLVALTFLGPCPDGFEVNHIDGDKTNNSIENLEYVTSRQNQLHAYRVGLQKPTRGSVHGRSKLTEADIPVIRARLVAGDTQGAIAKDYGVARSRIYDIDRGISWKHV